MERSWRVLISTLPPTKPRTTRREVKDMEVVDKTKLKIKARTKEATKGHIMIAQNL